MALRWFRCRAFAPSDLAWGGIVVDLEEDAIDACSYSRTGEDGDELRLAPADSVSSRGCLHGVRAVEDDRREAAHDGQRAHIDDEVVVAEARAAFGEEDAGIAALANLLDGMAHVPWGDELALLHVDCTSGLCGGLSGGDEQVGLAAEERRNLENVDGLGYGDRNLPRCGRQ